LSTKTHNIMKTNIILIIVLILAFLHAGAQHDSISVLQNEVNTLKSNSRMLQKGHNELIQKIEAQDHRIDSLEKAAQTNAVDIRQTAASLDTRISNNKTEIDHKYTEMRAGNWLTILFVIIGFLLAVLIAVIFYIVLRKRQKILKDEIAGQINTVQKSLDDESGKLNKKLTELSDGLAALTKKIEEKGGKNPA